jgi:hypothetical protein
VLSLFSSTNSNPTLLWSIQTDLSSDSSISLLRDDDDGDETLLSSSPNDGAERQLKGRGNALPSGNISSRVLHLQSPTVRATFIRIPRANDANDGLAITLPFLHLTVKDLDQAFYFEVGIHNQKGTEVVLRFSTFQASLRFPPIPNNSDDSS